MNLSTSRYAVEFGYPVHENLVWRQVGVGGVDVADPRGRSLPEAIIGIDSEYALYFWVWESVSAPLIDLVALDIELDGRDQFPSDHQYWDYYTIPVRDSVTVITKDQYDDLVALVVESEQNLVSSIVVDHDISQEAYDNAVADRVSLAEELVEDANP